VAIMAFSSQALTVRNLRPALAITVAFSFVARRAGSTRVAALLENQLSEICYNRFNCQTEANNVK
jgi:hypothetical protein